MAGEVGVAGNSCHNVVFHQLYLCHQGWTTYLLSVPKHTFPFKLGEETSPGFASHQELEHLFFLLPLKTKPNCDEYYQGKMEIEPVLTEPLVCALLNTQPILTKLKSQELLVDTAILSKFLAEAHHTIKVISTQLYELFQSEHAHVPMPTYPQVKK